MTIPERREVASPSNSTGSEGEADAEDEALLEVAEAVAEAGPSQCQWSP